MILRHFHTCLLLLLSLAALAGDSTGYNIVQYGTEDGLPSNGIKGLQWDKKTGFLWIATEAGMVRYNGMSFKTYTREDNPHITNERVLFLVRNNAGTIYTADNSGNIFSVRKNKLNFLTKKRISGNASSNIITLNVSDQFYAADHQVTNGPFSLQFDRVLPVSDTAFFILHAGRLFYFPRSQPSPVPVSSIGDRIVSGFRCGNEIFLADASGALWILNREQLKLTPVILDLENGPVAFNSKKSSFVWENGMDAPILFSGDQAWAISFSQGKLNGRLICNQVPGDVLVRYAQYDETAGCLFIGTDSKGIVIIKQNQVESVRKKRTSASERTSYYSQVELPDGNIMTNEGHILGKNNPEASRPGFSGPLSISTYRMGDSLFWFVQFNKLLGISCLHSYHFFTKKMTAYPRIGENFSQLVMAVSGGQLYFANENGIFRMEGDSLKNIYRYPDFDKQRIHFDMKEISPGVLLIANCNSLLQYHIQTNRMEVLFTPGNYCVRSFWIYKDYVFFGTYGGGLFAGKKGKIKPLPLDKNQHLLFTHCFIEDGNGYCWISTNRGLFKASIAEMINAFETDASQVYYHYFGRRDGMNMTEMNGGCTPCGIKLRNKTISFPTMEGLLWVNPLSVNLNLPDGEIFIDDVLVDNKRVDPESAESSELSAKAHDVQVHLGFSAWCNKENIYLDYRLNNEKEWKPVNVEGGASIQMSNLQEGSYTLYIRKLNGFGANNYSYREYTFTIPAPWHRQWWFYGLSSVTLFGLIALYLRFRTRQYKLRQRKLEQQVAEKTRELQQQNEILEKNNTIKTRLISIISHDIVTPLKFLTVAGKNLAAKRKLMSESLQEETILEMANTSQELQLLSTNILNWIKYQNENRRMYKETFSLHDLVNQVFGVLSSLARQKNLVLANETDPGLMIHQYQEPLKILIYNLVSNAINFTEQGSILVSGESGAGHVLIHVKDEGVGMTPEQIQNIMADQFIISSANIDNRKGNGLGYLIIKDLLKMMGAGFTIRSEKGRGTVVTVKIPENPPGN